MKVDGTIIASSWTTTVVISVLVLMANCASTSSVNYTHRSMDLIDSKPLLQPWVGLNSLVQEWITSFHLEETVKGILEHIDNQDCSAHIKEWISRLGQPENSTKSNEWMLQMIDSWGKLPEGILSGHVNAIGDFDECVNTNVLGLDINATLRNVARGFQGQYCTAYIVDYTTSMDAAGLGSQNENDVSMSITRKAVSFEQLLELMATQVKGLGMMVPSIATCFPSSCSKEDIQIVLTTSLVNLYEGANLNVKKITFPLVASCEQKVEVTLHAGETFMIVLLGILVCLTVTAGLVDCYGRSVRREGKCFKYFMAFSFYANIKRWLSTRKSQEDFGCLHGIRFLSTYWVVLCHTYVVFGMFPSWNLVDVKNLKDSWILMPVLNGTFAVDSFFVMSGTLASYNILKILNKTKGKMNIFMFYLHRYLRLTPTYAILIGIMATLVVHTGNGPMWTGVIVSKAQFCQNNWWTNILYINNLVKSSEMCVGESWYLANDMQFYILAPFIVYPLWKWQNSGLFLLVIYTILSCVSPALVVHYTNTQPTAILTRELDEHFNDLYIRPWTRIQTFLAGVWLGWVLWKTRNKRVILPKWLVVGLWGMSTVLAVTIIYYIKNWFDPAYEIPQAEAYAYTSVSRFTYALALCWVIFACIKGYGGIVENFLSWSVFMPLGRLTFCVYLTSMHLQRFFHTRLSVPLKYDTYMLLYLFFGHTVMTLLVGFVCSILFESPFIGLQRLIFNTRVEKDKPGPCAEMKSTQRSKRNGIFYRKEDTIVHVPDHVLQKQV